MYIEVGWLMAILVGFFSILGGVVGGAIWLYDRIKKKGSVEAKSGNIIQNNSQLHDENKKEHVRFISDIKELKKDVEDVKRRIKRGDDAFTKIEASLTLLRRGMFALVNDRLNNDEHSLERLRAIQDELI